MRHNLPKVGIPYRSVDGSASLEDVANHFQVSPIAIATASLPSKDGKRCMLLFETVVKGHKENISPRGKWVCSVFTSLSLADIKDRNFTLPNAYPWNEQCTWNPIIGHHLWLVTLWRSKLYGFTTRRLQEEGRCPHDHQLSKSGSGHCKWVWICFNGIVYGAGWW